MYNKNIQYEKNKKDIFDMTTILAVKCSDGIVFGADSQMSMSKVKELNYVKIHKIKNDILFAGAGDADYVERVKEELTIRYNNSDTTIPGIF